MIVAIYGARRQEPNKEAIAMFISSLCEHGARVIMHRNLYTSLESLMPYTMQMVSRVVDDRDFSADVAVSFGGDGTFLRTAMWVGDKNIPILGVNTGHLGYLSTAKVEDLPLVVGELIEGRYTIEHRSMIEVLSPELGTWPYALNEVVVNKYDTASMISAETCINGAPLASYCADGLIVATPTGSTAYNLSVGGPVIQPTAPVWVLSPISAHSLSMRPLVIADNSEVDITVDSRASGFRITLDGRTGTLDVGTTVRLRKAPFGISLICREGYEFPHALRNKLFWGA